MSAAILIAARAAPPPASAQQPPAPVPLPVLVPLTGFVALEGTSHRDPSSIVAMVVKNKLALPAGGEWRERDVPVFSKPMRITLYGCIAGMLYLGMFPNRILEAATEAVKLLR